MAGPDFLVIGAMKSGTTTLYHDLRSNPSIVMPEKESNYLEREDGEVLFGQLIRIDSVVGEVSPDYAKLPHSKGLADIANRVSEGELKIIYIVRDPICRLISHHHFVSTQLIGQEVRMEGGIDSCVRSNSELLDYSRYAMQIKPWVEQFGLDSVKVIRFEDYISNRTKMVAEICGFIGVENHTDAIDADRAFNQSEGRPVATPFWESVAQSSFYQKRIRSLISAEMREKIRNVLYPRSKSGRENPSVETLQFLVTTLQPEVDELADLLGHEAPLWNLEQTAKEIANE